MSKESILAPNTLVRSTAAGIPVRIVEIFIGTDNQVNYRFQLPGTQVIGVLDGGWTYLPETVFWSIDRNPTA